MNFSIDFNSYWSSPNIWHAGQVQMSALAFSAASLLALVFARWRAPVMARSAALMAVAGGTFTAACLLSANVCLDTATTLVAFSGEDYSFMAPTFYDGDRMAALIVALGGGCVAVAAMWIALRGSTPVARARRWPRIALLALFVLTSGLLFGAWRVALEQGEIRAVEGMHIFGPERRAELYATNKAQSEAKSLIWFYAASALASLAFGIVVSRRKPGPWSAERSPQPAASATVSPHT